MTRSTTTGLSRNNGNRFIGLVIGSVFLMTFLSAGLNFGPANAGEKMIDGVLHVQNSSTPTQGVVNLKMKELWSAGVGDDDDTIFGLIPRIASDTEGNVYVLDSQLCQVSVYSSGGKLLRTLFREGEGPGEVRHPRDMLVLDDGRVGLLQETPGEIVFVDRDGNPAGTMRVGSDDPNKGGLLSLTACDGAGQNIILSGTEHPVNDQPGVSRRINFASRFELSGKEIKRYAELYTVYDFTDFHFLETEHMPVFWWCFAACPDGTSYIAADRDQYRIQKYNPDGSLDRIIERETRPVKRPGKEFNLFHGIIETALTGLPVKPTIVVEENGAAIGYLQRGVRVRADGNLWVISAAGLRENPAEVLITFDVFNPAGEFIKQVALEGPGDPIKDGIFFVGKNRVVVVKGYLESMAAQFGGGTTYSGDDEEEPTVLGLICYELDGGR